LSFTDTVKGSFGCLFSFPSKSMRRPEQIKLPRHRPQHNVGLLVKKSGASKTFSDNIAFEELP